MFLYQDTSQEKVLRHHYVRGKKFFQHLTYWSVRGVKLCLLCQWP